MTDRELMQQALDALSGAVPSGYIKDRVDKHYQTMEALRARLAQPEPEPVAWLDDEGFSWVPGELPDEHAKDCKPLYLAPPRKEKPEPLWIRNEEGKLQLCDPPQREWQSLTDEEIKGLVHLIDWTAHWSYGDFARAIEQALKEKNNGG